MLFNKKSKLAWIMCIILFTCIMLIIQQLYQQSTHFWTNTSIDNIDISHLNYHEAVHKIKQHHSAPGYTIIDPQNKKVLYSKNFDEIKTTNYESQLKQRLSEQKIVYGGRSIIALVNLSL